MRGFDAEYGCDMILDDDTQRNLLALASYMHGKDKHST